MCHFGLLLNCCLQLCLGLPALSLTCHDEPLLLCLKRQLCCLHLLLRACPFQSAPVTRHMDAALVHAVDPARPGSPSRGAPAALISAVNFRDCGLSVRCRYLLLLLDWPSESYAWTTFSCGLHGCNPTICSKVGKACSLQNV